MYGGCTSHTNGALMSLVAPMSHFCEVWSGMTICGPPLGSVTSRTRAPPGSQVAAMLDSVKSRAKPALMDSYITPNADKDGMAILQNLRTLETQLAVINDMVCVASVVPIDPVKFAEVAMRAKDPLPNGATLLQPVVTKGWSALLQAAFDSKNYTGYKNP